MTHASLYTEHLPPAPAPALPWPGGRPQRGTGAGGPGTGWQAPGALAALPQLPQTWRKDEEALFTLGCLIWGPSLPNNSRLVGSKTVSWDGLPSNPHWQQTPRAQLLLSLASRSCRWY